MMLQEGKKRGKIEEKTRIIGNPKICGKNQLKIVTRMKLNLEKSEKPKNQRSMMAWFI